MTIRTGNLSRGAKRFAIGPDDHGRRIETGIQRRLDHMPDDGPIAQGHQQLVHRRHAR
jgi:hypothetical protein